MTYFLFLTPSSSVRALGNIIVIPASRIVAPTGLVHTRGQGIPTLSARAKPPSLVHGRALGAVSVGPSVRTVTVAGISRV